MSVGPAVVVPLAQQVAEPGTRTQPTGGRACRGPVAVPRQQLLPLVWTLPSGLPAEPDPPAGARVVRRHGPGSPPPAPEPATPPGRPGGGPPEPGVWAAGLVQSVVEVLSGQRPLQQLLRWLELPIYDELGRRLRGGRGGPGAPTPGLRLVSSVHLCEPVDGVVEATVLLAGGFRAQAAAVRLEAVADRWRCTRLAFL